MAVSGLGRGLVFRRVDSTSAKPRARCTKCAGPEESEGPRERAEAGHTDPRSCSATRATVRAATLSRFPSQKGTSHPGRPLGLRTEDRRRPDLPEGSGTLAYPLDVPSRSSRPEGGPRGSQLPGAGDQAQAVTGLSLPPLLIS